MLVGADAGGPDNSVGVGTAGAASGRQTALKLWQLKAQRAEPPGLGILRWACNPVTAVASPRGVVLGARSCYCQSAPPTVPTHSHNRCHCHTRARARTFKTSSSKVSSLTSMTARSGRGDATRRPASGAGRRGAGPVVRSDARPPTRAAGAAGARAKLVLAMLGDVCARVEGWAGGGGLMAGRRWWLEAAEDSVRSKTARKASSSRRWIGTRSGQARRGGGGRGG